MTVYLDFDGTVVEHQYPIIGTYNPGSLELIRKFQELGWEIILNTYRVEIEDDSLKAALDYINDKGICLPITKHTDYKLNPIEWNLDKTFESKVIYIDDIAPSIPLIPAVNSNGMMVDWKKIDMELSSYWRNK